MGHPASAARSGAATSLCHQGLQSTGNQLLRSERQPTRALVLNYGMSARAQTGEACGAPAAELSINTTLDDRIEERDKDRE